MIPQTPLPPADPTAVVGRRVLAYVIDGVILAVLVIVLFASLASTTSQGSAFNAELTCDVINNNSNSDFFCITSGPDVILIEGGDMLLIVGIAVLYGLVTHLLLPSITGFSPGKAMVGLRIVNQESFQKAGIGANIVRWLLWIVDGAPWCFPLAGLITGLSSNGHRRVGDMAAKTLVIDKKWVGMPMAVAGVNSVAAIAPPAPGVVAPPFNSPPPPPGSAFNAPPAPPTQAFPSSPPPPTPTSPPQPPAPIAPSATPPPPTPAPSPSTIPETTPLEPTPPAEVAAPAAPPPPPQAPPAPAASTPRAGVDAPQWDAARDTYIQWDPELAEWMEWNEAAGAWIPISQ